MTETYLLCLWFFALSLYRKGIKGQQVRVITEVLVFVFTNDGTLYGGLVAMFFALVAGLIMQGAIAKQH